MEQVLTEIFYDPSNPGGFSSRKKLWVEAKKVLPSIKEKDVKSFLEDQYSYTLHYPQRHKFQRNPVVVDHLHQQHAADLAVMNDNDFVKKNDGYRYILTIVDIFTKMGAARPLKTKGGKEVAEAFRDVYKTFPIPTNIQTDQGTEFQNPSMRKFYEDFNIHHFTSQNDDIKVANVERFNRTIKDRIFRFITSTGKPVWIDVLPKIIESYNQSVHSSHGMRPIDVNEENREEVFRKLYGFEDYRQYLDSKEKIPNIKVSDVVRVKYKRGAFDRGYHPRWSDRTYTVAQVLPTSGEPYFKLKDISGKIVRERFQRQNIQKISSNPKYRLKVLKRRTRRGVKEVFVNYLGYPADYNEWIQDNFKDG